MHAILTADSGSTKTHWVLSSEQGDILEIKTVGINPVRDSQSVVLHVLHHELLPQMPDSCHPQLIHFYGAGCIAPFSQTVCDALASLFPEAEIHVDTDLMGAARALCGNGPGIVCILGTGANCGLYDGQRIIENVQPLGFILGDEGSGAVLGRLLVGQVLKGQFSPALCRAFEAETGLTRAHVIDKVYRQPMPNRFLASLVPFLADHAEDAAVHALLVGEFRRFLVRNVAAYGRRDLPVSFVGGVAWQFRSELQQALEAEGYVLGRIEKEPIRRMAEFHQ